MSILMLLGAEGVSETETETWIRNATPEEVSYFFERTPRSLLIDDTGRPYFVVAINPDTAPAPAVEHARASLRAVRLRR